MSKINLMVIFGGKSGEHEVSLMSASSVLGVVDLKKYNVTNIGITKDGSWYRYDGPLEKIITGEWEKLVTQEDIFLCSRETMKNIDVVFPILHGPYGEDGTIQGLLEMVNVAYVGGGVLTSAVAMDKIITKKLCAGQDILQAEYIDILYKDYKRDGGKYISLIEDNLYYPVFVKPANLGSSVGISKARNREQLLEAIKLAFNYDRKIIVEEFISGREIECSVLGNEEAQASLPAEIIPSQDFYDYEDKYLHGTSEFEIPANLPHEITREIQELSLKIYKLLDCSGLARVDFFLEDKTKKLYFNEINTMPGFTKISMYPKMWEATGLEYEQLVDRLVELALERFKERPQSI